MLLSGIAAAGFIAALICHILGWLQINPPGGNWVFLLHVGCMALWIPLVIFANKTKPPGMKGNMDHLLAEVPKWVRMIAGIVFGYAILNFIYFIYCTSQFPKNKVPSYIHLRGFSGHWMMFYGIAAIGFFALARLEKKRKEAASNQVPMRGIGTGNGK